MKIEINIRYVDSFIRRYYLIISEIIINYEEQVLIIDIKKNRYYSIYRVPLDKRENLKKK